jgi:hypothetical protein
MKKKRVESLNDAASKGNRARQNLAPESMADVLDLEEPDESLQALPSVPIPPLAMQRLSIITEEKQFNTLCSRISLRTVHARFAKSLSDKAGITLQGYSSGTRQVRDHIINTFLSIPKRCLAAKDTVRVDGMRTKLSEAEFINWLRQNIATEAPGDQVAESAADAPICPSVSGSTEYRSKKAQDLAAHHLKSHAVTILCSHTPNEEQIKMFSEDRNVVREVKKLHPKEERFKVGPHLLVSSAAIERDRATGPNSQGKDRCPPPPLTKAHIEGARAKLNGFALTPKHVLKALHKMVRRAAPGPSGWTRELLIQVFSNLSSDAQREFCAMIMDIMMGNVGEVTRQILMACNLIPITKPEQLSLRPIALGDAVYKLACELFWTYVMNKNEVERHFGGVQLGVLAKCGAERMFYRIVQQSQLGRTVTAIDCVNAFNTLHREAILRALIRHELFHVLIPIFIMEYGVPTKLFYRPGRHFVTSEQGVRQGSVFGPLFFAIALQEVIMELQVEHPSIILRAYLDDIAFSSMALESAEIVKFLRPRMARIGLQMNNGKSKCYSSVEVDESRLPFACSSNGKLLGAFFGSQEWIKSGIMKKIHDKDVLWSALPTLRREVAIPILSACYMTFLQYNVRIQEPDDSAEAISFFNCKVNDVLGQLLDRKPEEFAQSPHAELLTLPRSKCGGSGIVDQSLISRVAHAASFEFFQWAEGKDPAIIRDPKAANVKPPASQHQRSGAIWVALRDKTIAISPTIARHIELMQHYESYAWMDMCCVPSNLYAALCRYRLCLTITDAALVPTKSKLRVANAAMPVAPKLLPSDPFKQPISNPGSLPPMSPFHPRQFPVLRVRP